MMLENLSRIIQKMGTEKITQTTLAKDIYNRPTISINLREKSGQAEIHDQATDITTILEGSGTLELGGTIENKVFRSLFEWRGDRLLNAEAKEVLKGDLFTINNGTPHRLIPYDKNPLIYLTYKDYKSNYLDIDKLNPEIILKIQNLKGLIMDADGTMTDGKVLVNHEGEEFASFSRVDSLAMLPWQKMGYKLGVISYEEVSIVSARAKKLKIDCMQNIKDKFSAAKTLLNKWGLDFEQVGFIGDDVTDLELLQRVGFSACPEDAQPQVINSVDLVIPKKRGDNVIRYLLDLFFLIQLGKLPDKYER